MLNSYILALNILTPSNKTVYCCDTRTSQIYKPATAKLLLLTKYHNESITVFIYCLFFCSQIIKVFRI
ncbi:hypothetical protein JOD96_001797 [Flavobacterium sp. 1355]|nr:hypothetical protein [Flavobacterium sp. 1355]